MWLVFGNAKKPDEPERYFLHAHMENDARCYWMHINVDAVGLNRNALFAEAVHKEQLGAYLELLQKKYGGQIRSEN